MSVCFDLTIAESLNLREALENKPSRVLPESFHARTGQVLSKDKSQVYSQLSKIQDYARENEMKINSEKTKFILFNPTEKYDFIPEYEMDGNEIETLEEIKILGLVLQNNLKWKSNTKYITKKAFKRLWIIQRLKNAGASLYDLVDVYNKQVRSILEFGTPVWNPGLTRNEISDIERVQKAFLHILLGQRYVNYEQSLEITGLESLETRRTQLCLKFAKKSANHPKHQHWFKLSDPGGPNTRREKSKFKPPIFRCNRLKKSPIPYLTNLLNTYK